MAARRGAVSHPAGVPPAACGQSASCLGATNRGPAFCRRDRLKVGTWRPRSLPGAAARPLHSPLPFSSSSTPLAPMAPKKADKKPAAAKTTKAAAKKGGKKRAKVRGRPV